MTNPSFIHPSDPRLQYIGRIDFRNPGAPSFCWAGSTITLQFHGTGLYCFYDDLGDWWGERSNAIGITLDDSQLCQVPFQREVLTETVNVTRPKSGEHILRLVKQPGPGGGAGRLTFRGLELAPKTELLSPPPCPKLKIEVYGDSITEGSGAACPLGQNDQPQSESARDSYANVLSRLLPADLHNLGIGGLAVQDGTGYYNSAPTGLQSSFDRLSPYNDSPRLALRLFTRHLVILGMGVNDASTNAFSDALRWREISLAIVRHVETVHGSATRFLFAVGPIVVALPYVRSLAAEVGADFYEFTFRTNGYPNQPESERMARELANFFKPLLERLIP